MIMKKSILASLLLFALSASGANKTIWKIGESDNSTTGFALAPTLYDKFLANDFGYEDRYFIVGSSVASEGFPYVLPGPDDGWGGTSGTAGLRTHEINIMFQLKNVKKTDHACLVVDLAGVNSKRSVVKLVVNNRSKVFSLGAGSGDAINGLIHAGDEHLLRLPLSAADLRNGNNDVRISVLEGGWVAFDQVRFEGSDCLRLLTPSRKAYLRSAKAAKYELKKDAGNIQPLLVDVEHLAAFDSLRIRLDGKDVYTSHLDTARYMIEVPMPAVKKQRKSTYEIYADTELLGSGSVVRSSQPLQTKADYVDTRIGSAHSRWMIAPGPWMPFGMVKMSPDNQNTGWQAGYQPTFETIGCFSHIHEWTMAGLGVMPTNGKLFTKVGDQFRPDEGYRSRMDKTTEEAPIGYYKVYLTDTKIWAELTATERASFMRFTYPKNMDGRVMIDLHVNSEYDYKLEKVSMRKVSDYRIEGISHQLTPRPHVWSDDADQDYTVHFVIEFDRPIKNIGVWRNGDVEYTDHIESEHLKDAGMFVEFDTRKNSVVQMRSGISLVSVANAADNLEKEISSRFGWSFEAVADNQKRVWNDIFDRVEISTDNSLEKTKFYTNMYHALCRNLWSDNNGDWRSADNKVRHFDNPNHVALGGDAFWNTFWNLNQFWNLVTPEWSSRWVNSQLAMYDANGWLAKGPAGMKYIPVMVAEHEIPLIVSAWQMGIRDFDGEKAFRAMKKMQTTPAQSVAGGFAGNRDIVAYMKYHYVPYNLGRFSNSLEYSFDDYAVGQMAKALGKKDDERVFADRATWWRNAFNKETGFAEMRDSTGAFIKDFDAFRTGANQHYVEGNAWQLSFFVPQDVPALVDLIGRKEFVDRLNWGFMASEPWRYNAPGDQYWDFPVVQGNQQSMHFPFLFNWAGEPWLTQKWTRSVAERYYGYGTANAYLGDEDQGQMSAWYIMAALGLFQTDGGCMVDPIYEIASPMFEKTIIHLGGRYGRGDTFTIIAHKASRKNIYVQSAKLNGHKLSTFYFPASELLKGGTLEVVMGPDPVR